MAAFAPESFKVVSAPVATYDWKRAELDLDHHGYAVLPELVTPAECEALVALYPEAALYRTRVLMARHGFGRGEYQYFRYPLPAVIADLRATLYPQLVPLANRWNKAFGVDVRYPNEHAAYIRRCHSAGQTRPTPLILKYGAGDYNCLHQDLYGEHVFPFQVALLLSCPERDFDGGSFVMTEHRGGRAALAEAVPLRRGDAVVFTVNQRPVPGARGHRRATMRHGVSRIHTGHRYTLGIIFHDSE